MVHIRSRPIFLNQSAAWDVLVLSGINPEAELLKKRSKQFALDVLAFLRTLPRTVTTRSIADITAIERMKRRKASAGG
jgi:hypothetical protein